MKNVLVILNEVRGLEVISRTRFSRRSA
jgi:hypothetical protein